MGLKPFENQFRIQSDTKINTRKWTIFLMAVHPLKIISPIDWLAQG
jgi:hypothetical protein